MKLHQLSRHNKQRNAPIAFSYIGIVGLLLLYVLSFILPSYQLKPSVISTEASIMGKSTSSAIQLYIAKEVHSFPVFLTYYNLEIITIILLLLTVSGFLCYFRRHPEA